MKRIHLDKIKSLESPPKILNIFSEKEIIFFQFLNEFFVILAFNNISGIFLSLIFSIIFGQISESIKKTAFGFQWFKNFFTKKFESKGKY